MGSEWQQLFDVVIVDGNKPKWFLQDIPFKEVRSVCKTGCLSEGEGKRKEGPCLRTNSPDKIQIEMHQFHEKQTM